MRTTHTLAATLAIAALAAPAAQAQDLRSPDTRDVTRPLTLDLRSPDARDAAQPKFIPKPYDRYYGIDRRAKPVATPATIRTDSGGIPAAVDVGFAGLVLVAAGAAGVRTRRRHRAVA
jgi:hypothetical protein